MRTLAAPRRWVARAVSGLIMAGQVLALVGVVRGVSSLGAAEAANYRDNAAGPPPTGFGEKGVRLSVGAGGGELVLTTDLTCPACQAEASRNVAILRDAIAAGQRSVWLNVIPARATSATNATAVALWVRLVAADPEQALSHYAALSAALHGVPDDASTKDLVERLANALPAALRNQAVAKDRLEPQVSSYFAARVYENRTNPGHVPSLTLDGREVSAAQLGLPDGSGPQSTSPVVCHPEPTARSCTITP